MVEILDSLASGAFAEIVETRDDDEALAGFVQDEADVAEVGVRDVLQLGQRARGPDADHGAASIKLAIEAFDRFGRLRGGKRDVDGGENAASERQQMCRKDELRFS